MQTWTLQEELQSELCEAGWFKHRVLQGPEGLQESTRLPQRATRVHCAPSWGLSGTAWQREKQKKYQGKATKLELQTCTVLKYCI